jgi:CheY-like chemotaxis protein
MNPVIDYGPFVQISADSSDQNGTSDPAEGQGSATGRPRHHTAYGDDSTRRKALEGGAEALLTKPIDFVALRSEINNRVAGTGAEVR